MLLQALHLLWRGRLHLENHVAAERLAGAGHPRASPYISVILPAQRCATSHAADSDTDFKSFLAQNFSTTLLQHLLQQFATVVMIDSVQAVPPMYQTAPVQTFLLHFV